jgi:hypothetical protein
MGIKFTVNKSVFRKAILQKMTEFDSAIISRFSLIGEQFVIDARSSGSYKDQTGNLRSSIGYMVLKNGKPVSISNHRSSSRSLGSKGKITKDKFLLELAKSYPTGYVLICVAGMEYAAAVESRGKDVITGSVQTAETSVTAALQRIFRKYP